MNRSLLLLLLVCPSAFAAAPQLPITRLAKDYCLAATPTVPAGAYVPIAITAIAEDGTTKDELDEIGRTFRTTYTFTGAKVTAISCPILQ